MRGSSITFTLLSSTVFYVLCFILEKYKKKFAFLYNYYGSGNVFVFSCLGNCSIGRLQNKHLNLKGCFPSRQVRHNIAIDNNNPFIKFTISFIKIHQAIFSYCKFYSNAIEIKDMIRRVAYIYS